MFRLLIVLAVVALLFPGSFSIIPGSSDDEDTVNLGDMAVMVQGAVADVGSVCKRQPEMCRTGVKLGRQARERASDWADTVHGWLTDDKSDAGASRS